MAKTFASRAAEILLVEDNPGDARLTHEALKDGKLRNNLHHVSSGAEALAFLRKEGKFESAERPDLILLDLNMPGLDGREVLAIIKSDDEIKTIPIVVLTTSDADEDILSSYDLQANCFITKPVDFDKFSAIVRQIESFWFTIVSHPA